MINQPRIFHHFFLTGFPSLAIFCNFFSLLFFISLPLSRERGVYFGALGGCEREDLPLVIAANGG